MDLPDRLFLWNRHYQSEIFDANSALFVMTRGNPGIALAVPSVWERDYLLGMQYVTDTRFNVIACTSLSQLHTTNWQAVFFLYDPRFPNESV